MPDKKLTDNEIVKALKELFEVMLCEGDLQRASTVRHTIDLINRQKAEIEKKQATIDSFTDIGKLYSEIKAEAYKEFAYELKQIPDVAIYKYEIDNLLKEKVGENDDR